MQVDLTKTVSGSSTSAFAIVANVTDWPRIVDLIKSVELLTAGPIVVRGHDYVSNGSCSATTARRPWKLQTSSRRIGFALSSNHPILHYELDYLIDGIYGGGCRMSLIFRSRPRTQVEHVAHPFMTPFMAITLRDELEQDLSDLAAAASVQNSLERSSQTPRF